MLVESGANVDSVQGGGEHYTDEEHCGSTPLCIAAEEGHEGVVEQLLKAGADVNKYKDNDSIRATPLCMAAKHGHEGVVDQLLEAGADLEAETFNGETPLFLAAKKRPRGRGCTAAEGRGKCQHQGIVWGH